MIGGKIFRERERVNILFECISDRCFKINKIGFNICRIFCKYIFFRNFLYYFDYNKFN